MTMMVVVNPWSCRFVVLLAGDHLASFSLQPDNNNLLLFYSGLLKPIHVQYDSNLSFISCNVLHSFFVIDFWLWCFVNPWSCCDAGDHLASFSLQTDNLLFCSIHVCWNQYLCKILVRNIKWFKFEWILYCINYIPIVLLDFDPDVCRKLVIMPFCCSCGWWSLRVIVFANW